MAFYLANRFILKRFIRSGILGIIIQNHLNDFIAPLVFFPYVNILLSYSKYSDWSLRSFAAILSTGLACSVFWEAIAPLLLPYSVGDLLDCASYLLGSLCYWLSTRKDEKHEKSNQYFHCNRDYRIKLMWLQRRQFLQLQKFFIQPFIQFRKFFQQQGSRRL